MSNQIVCCVLLAAGAGSRFEDIGHKLLAMLPATRDRPAERVFDRSLAAVTTANVGPVIVVTGRLTAHELGLELGLSERERNAVEIGAAGEAEVQLTPSISIVHNDEWASGQASSVQAGIDLAREFGAEVAVVGLGDQPGITATAWRNVAEASQRGAAIAVATYDGKRANPVALRRDVWDLLAKTGDEGARTLMRIRADLVEAVSCPGQPDDIDTVEDLHKWQSN